jgi:hypothetical protein|tara:strand:- start:4 stop:180 length:177 start_codon:yes stop_codon:yes gene_type:complete
MYKSELQETMKSFFLNLEEESVAFIIDQAVRREIFTADFRDRVVNHFIINKLNSIFER